METKAAAVEDNEDAPELVVPLAADEDGDEGEGVDKNSDCDPLKSIHVLFLHVLWPAFLL